MVKERRQAAREPVERPLELQAPQGGPKTAGSSRDLSRSGVFVHTEAAFLPGAPVRLRWTDEPDLAFSWGEVIRAEFELDRSGQRRPVGLALIWRELP